MILENLEDQKLNDVTIEYRQKCTLALIEAENPLASNFIEIFNIFPNMVEKRLQDISSMLLDIPLHNLVTQ